MVSSTALAKAGRSTSQTKVQLGRFLSLPGKIFPVWICKGKWAMGIVARENTETLYHIFDMGAINQLFDSFPVIQ